MASLNSLSILLLFLIIFASSIRTQSQKTQLSRRSLALADQQSQGQPAIPKPAMKKKKIAAQVEQEEEDQPILKSTTKKKKLASEQEQQEESITKPTTKKKKPNPFPHEEEQQNPSVSKSGMIRKKISLIDQVEDASIPNSPTKKKKQEPTEQEEEPASKPAKKKKSAPIEQEEDQADPKPAIKKKKLSPTDLELDPSISKSTTKTHKTSTFESKNQTKTRKSNSTSTSKSNPNKPTTKNQPKPINPIWLEEPDSDSDPDLDLIADFRDLPTRILPDLKKISITSKAYIYRANKNIAENMKPFVGNNFASKIALAFTCIFLILPLCLVTFLFYHLNSYLSLQRFLIFVQAYLAIYFFTLAVIAVVTGLEPLRFFYGTSPGPYAWTQAVQTLGYLLYLLVQVIHLMVVFSAGESRARARVLGLVQTTVGLAVGCHYYAAVFHRALTGEPPRANWKVHGLYAGCFMAICLCACAERGKKAYDGGEDGKKS